MVRYKQYASCSHFGTLPQQLQRFTPAGFADYWQERLFLTGKWDEVLSGLLRFRVGILLGLVALLSFPLVNSLASPAGFEVDSTFQGYYENAGGLPVFGYAIASPVTEAGRQVQFFERQRLEYHPEHAGTPYEVLLGHLGWQDAERRGLLGHDAFQPRSVESGAEQYFPETGHSLGGAFAEYWQGHGLNFGDDGTSFRESLALFGYPISQEFVDADTGLLTQYFERARFEFHPDNANTEHAVLLGHLGIEAMSIQQAAADTSVQPEGQSQPPEPSGEPKVSPQPVPATRDRIPDPANSVNVLDTGAKGDAVADDTDAIKRALDQAVANGNSTVFLPEGTYMIRAGRYWYPYDMEIIVPDGVSLVGASRDETVLKVIPESVTPSSDYWRAIEVRSRTQVKHLTLDGSKDEIDRGGFDQLQFQGIALAWQGMTDVLIEDVRVHDIIGMVHESFGILANGGHDSVYRNVETFRVEGTGIQLEGSPFDSRATGLRLENGVSYDNTWHGISVMGNDGAVVSNATVYDNDDMGISVEWNAGEILLEDVEAYDNGYGGIGSFGDNTHITIVRPNLYQNNARAMWFPGEMALVVSDHWAETNGEPIRGVTQHLEVRDCVNIAPRSGAGEVYFRYDEPRPDPAGVFDLQCEGSENWTVTTEPTE